MPSSITSENSTHTQNITPHLSLAEKLYVDSNFENNLPQIIKKHPALDLEQLHALTDVAQKYSLNQPRRAWAIIAIADAIAQRDNDLFLQSLTAWHLGYAANNWFRPQRVQEAILRASHGFTLLSEPGWIAACDWQQYAIPWLWPDFKGSVRKLEKAITDLIETNFTDFVPACRLSLAFANILVGDFRSAFNQINEAESAFRRAENQWGLGYCLYIKASAQRRSSEIKSALNNNQIALSIFQHINATVYVGMAQYNLGHIVRLYEGDFDTAETHFCLAAQSFQLCDLPIWVAQCQGGLAQVFTYRGQLKNASRALQQARQIYEQHDVPGLWADNLLDNGQLALFKGQYKDALSYLEKAEMLYRETGNQWMPAVALMDQGEVCLQQGRFHQALKRLEKAYLTFQELNLPHRQAECEWRLAHAWLHLEHTKQAHTFLDKAILHYEQAGHFGNLADALNRRAEIYLHDQEWDKAIPILEEVTILAQQQRTLSQTAWTQRLLGEAFMASGKNNRAFTFLQAAKQQYANMGMTIEDANCENILGRYYQTINNTKDAYAAWNRALALSKNAAPEIEWQAYAGLAEITPDPEDALELYRQAFTTLTRLRQSLWQPSLAGSLIKRPNSMINQAISLAAYCHSITDVLRFIEESKAQSITRQLNRDDEILSSNPKVLSDLVAEIRWLQQERRRVENSFQQMTEKASDLNVQFIEKVKEYDAAASQLERSGLSNSLVVESPQLNIALFTEEANAQLGKNWVALDYYYTRKQLYVVIITPENQDVWVQELPASALFLLDLITKGGYTSPWSENDLLRLGDFILPPTMTERITPSTYLLLAPHRQLHRLPWAALSCTSLDQPLAASCVPVIIPSFQSLYSLWQRQTTKKANENLGILIGISDFQGRYNSLPAVIEEVKGLQSLLGEKIHLLTDNQGTLLNLYELATNFPLSGFTFMHIAAHAFTDQLTGRLSGFALYDDDLWLDELSQLAPLPSLVTLSACNGLRSLIYEGDEQVGIATTCLAAGAQTVIGSLWPVLDQAAPDLMIDFYRYLLAKQGNAVALAMAQRNAMNAGIDMMFWGGYQCIGQP